MTDSQRDCLNSMAESGGCNISVVRAAIEYIAGLEAEVVRLRAAMKNAEEDLQRGYHATAAAILRVALEPKS